MTHRRLALLTAILVVLILCACDGAQTVCKPAPCGCEGTTKIYAAQEWECTQQNWQKVVR